MAKLISDAHLELSYRLGESAAPTDATELARRLNWFKTAINKVCAGDTPFWFSKTFSTLATVADRQDYPVPSSFRKMIELKVDTYKYEEIPFEEVYEKYELPLSPVPILPAFMKRAFYYRFDSIYLIPIPTTAPTTVTLSSLTSSALVATGTTATAHGLKRGDYIVISGATPAGYNGTFMIESVPTSTTFTFAIASTLSSPATGTITYIKNNIEIWFYSKPTEPTGNTSSIVVPDEYIDLIVAYAEGRYWSYAQRRGKAADAFTEFETRLEDLKKENFRKMFYAT